ncbi:MAG: hypothetical protein ACMUIU_17755 [bacterium]
MRKKDDINDFIAKRLKKSRGKYIPPKTECPSEDTLRSYIRGDRIADKESLIRHFLSCTECLHTLVALKDLEEAEAAPQKLPASLYRKALELLQGTSAKKEDQAKTKAKPKKIVLIWDKVRGKIAHIEERLEGIVPCLEPVPQPVRAYQKPREESHDIPTDLHDFPCRIRTETVLGPIQLELVPADREGYLTLSVSSLSPENLSSRIEVRLYKGDTQRAAVSFSQGKALFHRLKEGSYHLKFFDNEKTIEDIDIPIMLKETV